MLDRSLKAPARKQQTRQTKAQDSSSTRPHCIRSIKATMLCLYSYAIKRPHPVVLLTTSAICLLWSDTPPTIDCSLIIAMMLWSQPTPCHHCLAQVVNNALPNGCDSTNASHRAHSSLAITLVVYNTGTLSIFGNNICRR